MIYVVATTEVKPEHKESFIAGAKTCLAETVKEKGCISYDLNFSVTCPNVAVFVERWESMDDLGAHGRSAHIKVWRELSADMKAGPTTLEIITPADVIKR